MNLFESAAAGLALAVTALALAQEPREVDAATTAGTLVLRPALPGPHERVAARYQPDARLSGARKVTLRARVRRPTDQPYSDGIPVVVLAQMRRARDGTFSGTFVIPDSIVYAALVVEDIEGNVVDDNGGRDWELLTGLPDGTPRYDALVQRSNDMMGRNWESGFATVRRMTELYPDSLGAWSYLQSFQGWLGRADDDTVHATHLRRLAAFDSALGQNAALPAKVIGEMAWYAYQVDSVTARRWRDRLMRDAPNNGYAVQWQLLYSLQHLATSNDTLTVLHELDSLWARAPRDRRAQIATYAASVAYETGNTAEIRRWAAHDLESARDQRAAARSAAARFTDYAALRAEGMGRLRVELALLSTLRGSERRLGETVGEQRMRHDGERRVLLAALGRALVASGNPEAGLDTLTLATAAGWDLSILRDARVAALAAGNIEYAVSMAARIAVDPRSDSALVDSLDRAGVARQGMAGWQDQLDHARSDFVNRMLASAERHSLAGPVRVRALDGRAHDLLALAKGRVTLVAFWSRSCGPAVAALPAMNRVAARLARSGIGFIGIVDEPGSSPGLSAFLSAHDVTAATYIDSMHEASRAFNQWGTPNFYVVDPDGRVVFRETSSIDEGLARAEAVRLAARLTEAHTPHGQR